MTTFLTEPPLRPALSQLPPYVAGRRANSTLTAALASNESHYLPLPAVLEAVHSTAGHLNRYPDMAAAQLRERIAAKLSVSIEEVAVGPGSVGVLQQILAAMCDAGDEVMFAWRSFEAYPILSRIAGAIPVLVPLTEDEAHDLPAMFSSITQRTKVIIVCAPNNPTGVPIEHDELRSFIEKVPSNILIVIDEAYVEYVGAQGALDSIALFHGFANVCVLRTFSKAYGLAGLRIGYAIAHPGLAEGLRQAALPFGVSALAQLAATVSLDAEDELRERVSQIVLERHRVTKELRAAGWDVPTSHANFVWIRASDQLRESICAALAAADILVRGYAGDGVRITLADRDTNQRVLDALGSPLRFTESDWP